MPEHKYEKEIGIQLQMYMYVCRAVHTCSAKCDGPMTRALQPHDQTA